MTQRIDTATHATIETAQPAQLPLVRPRGHVAAQPPRGILLAVLELGVLGDLLMRAGGVGVNITLWCWALLAIGVRMTSDVPLDRRRATLLLAAAFFAAVPAWRDDEALVFFSGLAVLVLLVLLTWTSSASGVRLAAQTVGVYLAAALTAVRHIVAGAIPLLSSEARARSDAASTIRQPAGAIVRGLVLALPVLMVFGALLMEADAGYASVVRGLVRLDAGALISHVALTGVFAWLAAAYLTASVPRDDARAGALWGFRIGAIEAATVLALVDALFLSFVIFQARYLFGGVTHVLETAGLTYAEYARRGFFELVAISALSLPLLVATTSGARIETAREHRVHRMLAGALVGLLLLMMLSALSRMRIYQAEYGWTHDRLYATALMLWLGGSMIWFAATALRGAPGRFMIGSIASGLAVLASLVVVNPSALIVRANANRVARGHDFELQPVMLRADAMPALLGVLPRVAPLLDEGERCRLREAAANAAAGGRPVDGTSDWRTFRVATVTAQRAAQRRAPDAGRLLGGSGRCPVAPPPVVTPAAADAPAPLPARTDAATASPAPRPSTTGPTPP